MVAWWAWSLVASALAAAVAVAVEASRRRVLWSMAVRNAARRPRQTITVIAGLMVGTAIISASLVAGGSAGSAIRGSVYDALGDVDETVRLDAFNFFPEEALDFLRADPEVQAYFDGISPNVIWDVAVSNPRTDLFEPRVAAVGFDAEVDADFRPFGLRGGGTTDGRDLEPGHAIITGELADETDTRIGDRIELRYTLPLDPLVPEIHPIAGTLTVALAGGLDLPLPGPIDGPITNATGIGPDHAFTVDAGATSVINVIAWNPQVLPVLPPTATLHIHLTDPDGRVYESPGLIGSGGFALPPVWLNVSADSGYLPDGEWSLRVTSPLAAMLPYGGASIVLYPIYDATELQKRIRDLQDMDLGPFEDLADFDPFGEPESIELTVAAISDGGRGLQFDFHNAVFFDIDEAQTAFDRDGEINVIKLSNPGGIAEGYAGTAEAERILNRTLAALKEQYPDEGAIQALDINPVKKRFVDLADDSGQLMTGLLLFAGSLTVISGLLLIINIFTMLAEERREELGMARAVGMTRRDIVRLFLFEGSLYAVAAAAIGAILGLGLARLMISILNAVLEQLESNFPAIPFEVRLDWLLVAFAAGALLTFVTIAAASRRIARLNIVRAIRRIEDPQRTGTWLQALLGFALAGVGLAVGALGWLLTEYDYRFSLQVFGPMLFVAGLGVAGKKWIVRSRLYPTLAGTLAVYYAVTYFLITKYENISEANIVGPIRGVVLTLCIVVMAVYFEAAPKAIGRLLGKARRLRAVGLPAMSYPQHKRFRTGMTLAMFSIVLLSIGFFSIFGGLFDRPAELQTGGFDIEATTTLAVEDLDEYDRGLLPGGLVESRSVIQDFFTPDVSLITVSGERTGQFTASVGHHVYGIDQEFVDAQSFRLLWRLAEYDSDDEAYDDLLVRDDAVIVSYSYSTDERNQDLSHEVGETLQLHVGDTPREYVIIGIQEQWHFPGIWLPAEDVRALFPTTTDSFYLYKLADGADAEEAAKLLERNYRDVGMDAEASVVEVEKEQAAFNQILSAMKLFLGLGLIVGVLSLGIITARSVIERRQEIGMLRALGFTRTMVRRIFLIEMTFTVVMGAIIGIAASIVVSFGLWFSIIRELQYPYSIPWGEILLLIGISYVVALAATIAPIRRASKVAPAEALRYIE